MTEEAAGSGEGGVRVLTAFSRQHTPQPLTVDLASHRHPKNAETKPIFPVGGCIFFTPVQALYWYTRCRQGVHRPLLNSHRLRERAGDTHDDNACQAVQLTSRVHPHPCRVGWSNTLTELSPAPPACYRDEKCFQLRISPTLRTSYAHTQPDAFATGQSTKILRATQKSCTQQAGTRGGARQRLCPPSPTSALKGTATHEKKV